MERQTSSADLVLCKVDRVDCGHRMRCDRLMINITFMRRCMKYQISLHHAELPTKFHNQLRGSAKWVGYSQWELRERKRAATFICGGAYEIALNGIGWQDSLLLFAMFHSMMIGGFNSSFVEDPELDALLEGLMFAPDGETHLQASADAQRYIIEQALVVPLYTSMAFSALSNRVQGWVFSPGGSLCLDDACSETGRAE